MHFFYTGPKSLLFLFCAQNRQHICPGLFVLLVHDWLVRIEAEIWVRSLIDVLPQVHTVFALVTVPADFELWISNRTQGVFGPGVADGDLVPTLEVVQVRWQVSNLKVRCFESGIVFRDGLGLFDFS